MQNVHELFSKGRDLPVELVPVVERICLVVEKLHKALYMRDDGELLWERLEELVGVESTYNESAEQYEANQVYKEENGARKNVFNSLCNYLPAHFGMYTDYVVLPNNFVLFLNPASLHYGLNIDNVSSQIRAELRYAEEMEIFFDEYEDDEAVED